MLITGTLWWECRHRGRKHLLYLWNSQLSLVSSSSISVLVFLFFSLFLLSSHYLLNLSVLVRWNWLRLLLVHRGGNVSLWSLSSFLISAFEIASDRLSSISFWSLFLSWFSILVLILPLWSCPLSASHHLLLCVFLLSSLSIRRLFLPRFGFLVIFSYLFLSHHTNLSHVRYSYSLSPMSITSIFLNPYFTKFSSPNRSYVISLFSTMIFSSFFFLIIYLYSFNYV